MSPLWRSVLRGLVIAGGAGVMLASVWSFRLADWPIYVVFLLVQVFLFLPAVDVLPGVTLAIPLIAATIGSSQ